MWLLELSRVTGQIGNILNCTCYYQTLEQVDQTRLNYEILLGAWIAYTFPRYQFGRGRFYPLDTLTQLGPIHLLTISN